MFELNLTLEILMTLMPTLTQTKAEGYIKPLKLAMQEFAIDDLKRGAAFLAQIGHESLDLRYMEEIADGSAYEYRKDLGNTFPGDGRRYKGRSPIMLTGRHNYSKAGRYLNVDFTNYPELVSKPPYAFRVAGWFWTKEKNLSPLADKLEFDTITKKINGGYNGKADRDSRYIRALRILNAI